RMPEHDDEGRPEARGGEFHAPDLRGRDNVARHPDHEQIAQPLIEDDFRRHPGVGTTQDSGEWILAIHELLTPRVADERISLAGVGDESAIAVLQESESFERWHHGG